MEPAGGGRWENLIPGHHGCSDGHHDRSSNDSGDPTERHRGRETVQLLTDRSLPPGMKFDRDPQQPAVFLAQVLMYKQEYGNEIPTEGAKVRVVTLAREGAAGR